MTRRSVPKRKKNLTKRSVPKRKKNFTKRSVPKRKKNFTRRSVPKCKKILQEMGLQARRNKKMAIVVLIASIYTFLETVITGYLEYKNNNKPVGILLYVIALFCLIVTNFIV